MIRKFLLKNVAAPLLGTIAAKVGEAIGDVLAYHINPPAPEETPVVVTEPLDEDESI